MAHFPRYAIYYAAARGGALDRFGAAHLGYDAWTGDELPFPDGLPPDWLELTQNPRKYGFHATLKPPFALAPGKSESELTAACADLARTPRPIPVIAPVVRSISGIHCRGSCGGLGRTRATRRRLRPRVRSVPCGADA